MILLDTDVLIDVALDRHPHADPAAELLDRIEHGAEAAFIAWHSVANFYYLVAPALGRRERARIHCRPHALRRGGDDRHRRRSRYAAALPLADFEDALQMAAARACGARHIVTRNVRDYARSPIRAVRAARGAERAVLIPGASVAITRCVRPGWRIEISYCLHPRREASAGRPASPGISPIVKIAR